MKTIEEMIEVMTAFKNGAKIECLNYNFKNNDWQTVDNPSWNWDIVDFRIKEQKKKDKK